MTAKDGTSSTGVNMVNMRDIARAAGVGIATVSRYINETGYVSEESAQKIQEAIDYFQYSPNALAKAVFGKRLNAIGLVIPNIANPFYAELATQIEYKIRKRGYSLILCNTEDDQKKEIEYIELLKSFRVAGVITARPNCKSIYEELESPVVSFEQIVSERFSAVLSDNHGGGRLAFEQLYRGGCQRILVIHSASNYCGVYERLVGFSKAARENSISFDTLEVSIHFDPNQIDQLEDQLNNIDEYDGIFIVNDIIASLVLRKLHKKGIEIPSKIQIVSYDNTFLSQLVFPSLTTIDQRIDNISSALVDVLFRQVEYDEKTEPIYKIETEIIIRESTK